jgi:hypothetical protein
VREDAIGAQATAKQNRTFADDARIWKLPRLALLAIRQVVKRQRPIVQKALVEVKQKARARQLLLLNKKVMKELSTKQQAFADAVNAYGMELQTKREYLAVQNDATETKTNKVSMTKEAYRLIFEGMCKGCTNESKYETQLSNWKCGKKSCQLSCSTCSDQPDEVHLHVCMTMLLIGIHRVYIGYVCVFDSPLPPPSALTIIIGARSKAVRPNSE